MRYGLCNGCKMGDHSRHKRSVVKAPEGVMGGVVCNCEGDCKPPTMDELLGVRPGTFAQKPVVVTPSRRR